ncbi:MAG: hypothetical protein WD449_03225 [Candidatus Babeliales bacterium]
MKNYNYTVLILIIVVATRAERAWICVSVADLIGQRMSTIHPATDILQHYHTMPYFGKGTWACPRIGQALFGQEVTIKKIEGDEALISIKNLFYQTDEKKRTKYWTLASNIISQTQLTAKGTDYSKLPPPIDYTDPTMQSMHTVITLIAPWHSEKTTYSVGTRFLRALKSDTHTTYAIWVLNPTLGTITKQRIPKKICMVYNPTKTTQEKRAKFVALLRQWADQKNGFIPYVWGGFSIIAPCNNRAFIKEETTHEERYEYAEKKNSYPKDGLDCSGLVALAAQCCGLPYFLKNSSTILRHLATVKAGEPIQCGDLIWFPGHVVVISNLNPALVIEARGYTHGYGKVQEISLEKSFKGIITMLDIQNALAAKRPLERLDSAGKTVQHLTQWNVLTMFY